MKKQILFQFLLVLLLFNYFFTFQTHAVTYDLSIEKGDIFIWEVKKCDKSEYEKYFYEEPDFEEGVQKKIEILKIEERSDNWRLTFNLWDYTHDTDKFEGEADEEDYKKVYMDPKDQADKIYEIEDIVDMWVIPTPFLNYLEEFRDSFENEFFNIYVDESSLYAKYAFSHIEYEIKITYTYDGVAELIEYINSDNEDFIKISLERETSIPGFYLPIILLSIFIFSLIILILMEKELKNTSLSRE
ncbi:MAG: hypothetical protein ACTSQJ_02470 [Promethearchaeota archaeon]